MNNDMATITAPQPLISIIVPVFKAEGFLRIALNSILAQTFANWEAILVNDGSPDNSGKICDEYAKTDSRFKVIHKEKNEGTLLARKSALEIARGIYIAHLDSDDYYDAKFLEKMYNKAVEIDGGYDMVFCGYKIISPEGNLIRETRFKSDFIWEENKEDRLKDYFTKKYSQFALWNTLVKREFYDKVIFPGIFLTLREDTFIYMQLCFFMKTVALLKENLYSYIHYTNTASHQVQKSADDVLRKMKIETVFYEHSCMVLKRFNDEKYLNTFIKYYSPIFVSSKVHYFSLPRSERMKLKKTRFLERFSELHKHAKLKHKILLFLRS
jgi:glycosyltransferase involved in cell wall biosynthesis